MTPQLQKKSYDWHSQDIPKAKKNSNVYTAFCGAGGSAYGYRLAGCNVVGACDIDNKAKECFLKNHPETKVFHHTPIKKLIKNINFQDLNIDILDAHPELGSFASINNNNNESEPNDLIFDTLNLAEKIKPKIIIIQTNYELLQEKFKSYLQKILSKLTRMLYNHQSLLVDSSKFGVAQKRDSALIIANNLYNTPKLKLETIAKNNKPINCKEAFKNIKKPLSKNDPAYQSHKIIERYHKLVRKGASYANVFQEFRNTRAYGNWQKIDDKSPCLTLTSLPLLTHYDEPRLLTLKEYMAVSSFPIDFKCESEQLGKYFIGSATPPFLIMQIMNQIHDQWLSPLVVNHE